MDDEDEDIWADVMPMDRAWSWKRLLAVGVQLVANVTTEIGEALDCVATLIIQDVAFDDSRLSMQEQAALELEALVAGEDQL